MKSHWRDQLGLEHAVVQAGMGGGIANSVLAAAVSRAGGLGTVGLMPPTQFADELRKTREACGERPFAANLLMPFVRRAHVRACLEHRPASVSLFFGFDRDLVQRLKAAGIYVMHQVGTEAQAQRAVADGADALIIQGEEAGGHLAGTLPLAEIFAAIKRQISGRPLLAAGGIHDAATARAAKAMGADGIAAGTRFLLTPECNAHPQYQSRLLEAEETLCTKLFGLTWPAPHRVVPNAATRRWCATKAEGPAWATVINTLAIPSRNLVPMEWAGGLIAAQRLAIPVYSPFPLTRDLDARSLDVTPLYAGRCVRSIHASRPAAEIVAELAAAISGQPDGV
jgi:NAD(P)H-dependent flavin oxidoreductase YrpB (nitropropane dioxygenase family)